MKAFNVAVVGATGAVGETMIDILASRKFPVAKLYPLASERSVGDVINFKGKTVRIKTLTDFDFSQVDVALFSAGSKISEKYAPMAAEQGCVVIDNSSCFRYEDDIPLLVPEVNPEALHGYKKRNIIANPNCSTIQMLVALKPIYDRAGIKRINVATYQAVSGSGKAAISELVNQTTQLLNGKPCEKAVYPKQIAFNVIPQIDEFQKNGYTREEMKMVWETQKIFNDPAIKVNPTTVRVPVLYGHSEAIHLETRDKISIKDVRDCLKAAPGVALIEEDNYPTPFDDANGRDEVFVGRIRKDLSHPKGINLWVVADNVRKGAALNAVQIAELLIEEL